MQNPGSASHCDGPMSGVYEIPSQKERNRRNVGNKSSGRHFQRKNIGDDLLARCRETKGQHWQMQLEDKTFQIGLVDIGFGGNLHEIRRYDRSQQDVTALYPTQLHSEHQPPAIRLPSCRKSCD